MQYLLAWVGVAYLQRTYKWSFFLCPYPNVVFSDPEPRTCKLMTSGPAYRVYMEKKKDEISSLKLSQVLALMR